MADTNKGINVTNSVGNTLITGTAYDDTINNSGTNVTINAGASDDKITNSGTNVLIQYTSGDGNDLITGFNATSTLSIGGGNYSSVVSGNDVVLTVGDEEIVLNNAANLDTLNIVGNSSSGDTTSADTTSSSGNDTTAAAVVADMILHRTEEGYPVIAGLVLNPTTYHGDEPTNYVSKETWSITSTDGLQLEGYHYTPENSNDKWVVIVHGYGHNHKHMYPFTGFYLDNGYNVLMVDQRAAGESEGEYLTMGAAEGKDIALWTQEIARRYPDSKITLFGVSMGSATAMIAASRSDIKNVTSLVEDCGYTNAMELVKTLHSNIQTLQDLLPAELLPALDNAAGSLTGYKLSDADPIGGISNAKMPTLFITGTNDSVVPASMLTSLYDASGATVKEKFIVEGANHGLSGLYDPVGYSNATFRFLAEANGEGWVTENVVDGISLRGTKYGDSITNSGDNVTIDALAGNDFIDNSGANVSITGGADDNTISNKGNNVTINGASNEFVIINEGSSVTVDASDAKKLTAYNSGDNVLITGSKSADTILNGMSGDDSLASFKGGKLVTIDAGAGNDYIANEIDSSVTVASEVANFIDAGTGNDTIYNAHSYHPTLLGGDGNDSIVVSRGHMTYIDGGAGNDSIIGLTNDTLENSDWAMGGHATLLGGDGNDYIHPFYTNNSTLDGGKGNDTIVMMGADSTITGGAGNDRISLGSADSVNVLINYATGDGNDVIYNFTENDTLSIADGTYTSTTSGSNVVLRVGSGKITLDGAASLDNINIVDGSGTTSSGEVINNAANNTLVTGTAGNDTITNTGNRATIDALAGNDLVTSSGSNVALDAGTGNDSIYASGKNSTIDGGDGSNFVSVTDSQGLYVVFNGQTTVDNFNLGFGDGTDTVYIPGAPAAVGFRSGILTFYDDSNAVVLSGVTTTAKVNLYHESRHMLNKGVFIAANDWYSVESDDLSVKSGEEVYFVGPSDTAKHGVDFSGISSKLNLTLDTAYIDSEDYVPGTTTWINGVYSIRGGAGDTTITGSNLSDTIFAGTGDTTINARGGNDYIDVSAAQVRVNYASGDGNDVINGFDTDDTLDISGAKYYSVESGNNLILTVGNGHLTLRGAATLDNLNIIGSYDEAADEIIRNSTNAVSVVGTSGNDTITNTGNRATIDALAGNDSITSSGSSVVLYAGDGNDTILASGANSTIDGGAGSNLVSVTGSQGLFVALNGKTTVNGFNTGFGSGSDTVYIAGDPAVDYKSGGLTLYEENSNGESLTFDGVTDVAKLYLHYTSTNRTRKEVFIPNNVWYSVEDSDFSTGNGDGLYFVGATAGQNHGIDFSDISRSLNVTLNTDYDAMPQFWVNNIHSIIGGKGNTTITGSDTADTIIAGTGNTTIDGAGGNDNISLNSARSVVNYWSNDGNDFIAGFNENSTLRVLGDSYDFVTRGGDVIVSVGEGRITLQGAADLEELNIVGTLGGGDDTLDADVYSGGDEVISDYAGQPVVFNAEYRGALFNGSNFIVYSADGSLTFENIADKVIDLRDVDGNEALKAYTASTAGTIDGRGLLGYEVIAGAETGTDIIYAGDGGANMWGGTGFAADALIGGAGSDMFVGGRLQGADNFFNVSSADIVNLSDSALSDIVATAEVENNTILVGFNTGNIVAVQSTDTLSATFMLADGTTHRYNHTTKTWQSK